MLVKKMLKTVLLDLENFESNEIGRGARDELEMKENGYRLEMKLTSQIVCQLKIVKVVYI